MHAKRRKSAGRRDSAAVLFGEDSLDSTQRSNVESRSIPWTESATYAITVAQYSCSWSVLHRRALRSFCLWCRQEKQVNLMNVSCETWSRLTPS